MEIWKKRISAGMILICIGVGVFLLRLYFSGEFSSVETLQTYMRRFGVFAPLVLMGFQAMQVVIPVLPSLLGFAVGAVMFGTMGGFWCNYIGICVGSVGAYLLARKFGIDVVLLMFAEEKYEKWRKRIEKSKGYETFLFVATLLPLFPDDFLCYFSGLIKMNWKKFLMIIVLGKPWCILAYSFAFGLL